ncbi:MAG: hypothetical protein R3228_04510 [Halioglobus sp.]|nr:hypothetical protein [Halioglobus sp.]
MAMPLSIIAITAAAFGLIALSPPAFADDALHYGLGARVGARQLEFDFSAMALPSFVSDGGGTILLENSGGEVEFGIDEALYFVGLWGGLFVEGFSVTGQIEISTEESSRVSSYTEEFADLSGNRASDISRVDYSFTLSYALIQGLSLFSGFKHTKFEASAREDSFLLGLKDQTYQEEGFFLGTSYVWHFESLLSLSLSLAYAYLDLDFSEDGAERPTALGPVSFGEFSYNGTARGLSVGVQANFPITDNWYYNAGIMYQEYVSKNNSSTLDVFPRAEGLVSTPAQVVDLDTEHADTVLTIGLQYIF